MLTRGQHSRSPIPAFSYPSSSDFSPMMRPAPPTWSEALWGDGFACPLLSSTAGEPFHFENRPGVLSLPQVPPEHRADGGNSRWSVATLRWNSLSSGNAYLVASQTPGMSAVQFQRQLGLSTLRDGLSNSPQAPLGSWCGPTKIRILVGQPKNHARAELEVDETWVGGRTRGAGRGVHHKVALKLHCADRRYAGRVRLRRRARPSAPGALWVKRLERLCWPSVSAARRS